MKTQSTLAVLAMAIGLVTTVTLPEAAMAQAASPAQDGAAAPAPAQQGQRAYSVPELRQIANNSYTAGNYPVMLQAVSALHDMRPWNQEYMTFMVLAHALNGNQSLAYEMMLKMQTQGLSFDFNSSSDTESIRGTQAYDYINDLMVRAGDPAGASEHKLTLSDDYRVTSDIAWDPTRKAFLVGDIQRGHIVKIDLDGESEVLLRADEENGLWGVYGINVDAENNRLWVSSSATVLVENVEETDVGRAALLEFELDSMRLVKRYPVPADGRKHQLGDIARVPNGDLYVLDSILPVVYKLAAGGDRIAAYIASRDNVYFRGIASNEDGTRLYLSDYELGITVLDLEGRTAAQLTGPENLNFGGIEGIEFWNGHLVMIQGGIYPQRVMRLKLSADGASVEDVAPLTISQPYFDHPSFGTVVNDELWFITNSYGLRNSTQPSPTKIAVTGLESAPNLIAPDVDKFWDEYYEKSGIERPDPDAPPQADGDQ